MKLNRYVDYIDLPEVGYTWGEKFMLSALVLFVLYLAKEVLGW